MRQFTTGDLNKQVGDVTDAASREPVVLTKHRKPRFVLMSYGHCERMRTGGDPRSAHRVLTCRRNTGNSSPRRSIDWRAGRGMTMSREFLHG